MNKIEAPDASYPAWKRRMYKIIFEADTPAGKLFDLCLLILIVFSVVVICIESLPSFAKYSHQLLICEYVVTGLFTIEYICRIVCVRKPSKYIFSFFGIVDLLSILPTYIGLFLGGGASFAVLRAIRLLRVFRVLKLVWLIAEANELGTSVWAARGKIIVFLMVVVVAVTIAGAVMYELEGPDGLMGPDVTPTVQSIPEGIYWAIVTMTTVGYGDFVPNSNLGKAFSSLLILLGYSLIIVPTGFVSAEFLESKRKRSVTTRVCDNCMSEGHDVDAKFCKYCSQELVA